LVAAEEFLMTETQQIIDRLERQWHELMLQITKLEQEGEDLALAILTEGHLGRQKLREIGDQVEYYQREVGLHDLALAAARRRALSAGRDCEAVMREIAGGKVRYEP
jgi:hypothetical protein